MSSSLIRKIFTSVFPPPHFLEMPTIGLDITDDIVRYAELKRVGSHYELGFFGEEKIAPGVVEGGYVNDKMALTAVLAGIQKKQGKRYVIASLPEEKTYLFKTSIPMMPEKDIYNALQFKIEENVPIVLAEAIFDYSVSVPPKETDTSLEVVVSAIHSKVVANYLEVLHGAGFVPLQLMTESQAVAHISITPGDSGVYMVVALRRHKAIFLIVSKGTIHFTSTVALERNLTNSENIGPIIQAEIQRLLLYWEGKGGHERVHTIMLSGAYIAGGLDAHLARSFAVPVTLVDAWKNIAPLNEYLPQITRQESQEYIPVLGLALPHEQ